MDHINNANIMNIAHSLKNQLVIIVFYILCLIEAK